MTSENGGFHPNGSGAAPVLAPFPAVPETAPEPQAPAQPEPEDVSPETLIFRSGLITPDQLGELVEERVRTGRPVHEIVVDRGWLDHAAVASVLSLEGPEPTFAVASTQPAPIVLTPAPADPFAPVAAPVDPFPPVAPPVDPFPPVAAPVDPFALGTAPAAEPLPVDPYAPAPEFPAAETPLEFPVEFPIEFPVEFPVEPPVELVVGPAFPPAVEPEAPSPEPELPAGATLPEARVEFCLFVRFRGNERVHLATFVDADVAKEAAREAAEQVAAAGDAWPFLGGRFVRPDAVLSIDVDPVVR